MALANMKDLGPGCSADPSISIAGITDIYAEMFELLEDYAPSWYTEELHNRAAAGLDALKRLIDVPVRSNGGHTGA